MSLKASELILNEDGSIYHLGLLPEELANTVITVGDPARVSKISVHFDSIEVKKQKREFCTHTGIYKGKRITVMSTGMGTDNIDIALTELDALVNIDLKQKKIKEDLSRLDIIRIGTTGSIREEIPIGSFIVSEYALGFDGLMHYYKDDSFLRKDIAEAFVDQTDWSPKKALPYVVEGGKELIEKLSSDSTIKGLTGTNVGFYGPQGRILRAEVPDPEMNNKIAAFNFNGHKVTNLEMETSGIYGISKLLGHNAASMNLVLANRATGEFLENASEMMDKLIIYTLDKIAG
ncbi:nucleoside phosphorylase [Christiangramia sp. SM2212]|uniref:Uridine phosphorylase n=1 Tax=Christiangramia sediminicola TaxID=3073267 RepID=A0ABU1EPH5_9FLAO|nr:nucleoside phosphorylase [Christiangramia sp. SM2212]MDR5590291.1 nucleoside phosphorylase [Christiangramia sp. SM2212]